jgi:hypothetical protein
MKQTNATERRKYFLKNEKNDVRKGEDEKE